MYEILENLINNKYYSSREEVEKKLSVFYAYNVITEEEYKKLMDLVEEKYGDSTNTEENE